VSEIEFTLPGEAVPWARAAGGKTAHRFTPAKQRNYMGALRMFCQRALNGQGPINGPIELSVMAVYAWPKSLTSRKRALPGAQWKTSRADVDNLTKMVGDALNTVAWRDDSQITSLHAWKMFGDVPRLVVKIRSLDSSPVATAPS
jgi:Holliday junction resolvase RusA-like endonuclease